MSTKTFWEIINCDTNEFIRWSPHSGEGGCIGGTFSFEMTDAEYSQLIETGTWPGDPHAPAQPTHKGCSSALICSTLQGEGADTCTTLGASCSTPEPTPISSNSNNSKLLLLGAAAIIAYMLLRKK